MLEALLVSTGLVALGEIGDKTQLLAFVLAARFKKPIPIVCGILVATLANHALAAWLGAWVASWLGPDVLRWVVGAAFLGMAAWLLVPDSAGEAPPIARYGVFVTTLVAFFLAEMGDKTQLATVALAAHYAKDWLTTGAVVAGTTFGMMLANAPAVYLGQVAAHRLNPRLVHGVAAAMFAVLGVIVLLRG